MRDPPVPIDAVINIGFGSVLVTFDRTLQVGLLAQANWGIRFANFIRPLTFAEVNPGFPTQVGLTIGAPLPNPGPDIVTYAPPPFDVISDTVKPTTADAFADFPLHA